MKPKQAPSGPRPLSQKLGIRPGYRVALVDPPEGYDRALGRLPPKATIARGLRPGVDVVQLFATDTLGLADSLPRAKASVKPDGMIWVSWPKRSSTSRTDLTDKVVRELGLENGLVDVKVCAIDDRWSGLKFVRRLEDRPNGRTRLRR